MRKRVNILFVALAACSVVYGMFLRYSPENEIPIIQNKSVNTVEPVVSYDDGIVDLDALELGND